MEPWEIVLVTAGLVAFCVCVCLLGTCCRSKNQTEDRSYSYPTSDNMIYTSSSNEPTSVVVDSGQNTVTDGQITVINGQNTVTDGQNTAIDGQTTVSDRQTTVTDGQTTAIDGQTTVSDRQTTVTDGQTPLKGGQTTVIGQTTLIKGHTNVTDGQSTVSNGHSTISDEQTSDNIIDSGGSGSVSVIGCDSVECHNDGSDHKNEKNVLANNQYSCKVSAYFNNSEDR